MKRFLIVALILLAATSLVAQDRLPVKLNCITAGNQELEIALCESVFAATRMNPALRAPVPDEWNFLMLTVLPSQHDSGAAVSFAIAADCVFGAFNGLAFSTYTAGGIVPREKIGAAGHAISGTAITAALEWIVWAADRVPDVGRDEPVGLHAAAP
jgi:hypothetical protein